MAEQDKMNTGENRAQEISHIGKYEIIRLLGQGGEGCVYLAYDRDLKRYAAIKELASERETIKEAELLQQLSHPMLPVIYDLFYRDAWYLVMEYVRGMTLGAYIEQNGYIGEERACVWIGQLADVLEYMHTIETPVIYRDLKPDNIMVCPEGHLRLIDLGAAYSMGFGEERGSGMALTYGYAAPEQLRRSGAYADARSDIYALGKVIYYMVTGADPSEPPYTALSIHEYQPLLSRELERLIRKCIMDDPQDRYQTAAGIRKDLKRCGNGRYRPHRRGFIRTVEKKVWLTEKSSNSGSVLLDIKNV